MKHSINFYHEELRPKVYYLTLKNTVIATVGVILAVVLWLLILTFQNNEQMKLNARAQNQLDAKQGTLTQLQEALVQHNDKATFNERKLRLEKSLEAKKMLWEGVGKSLKEAKINYHTAMDELTKLHEENIWLTHFEFSEASALFSGFSLDSSSVTRWMTQLQASESFQGREFSHLNIKAADDQALSFVIATERQQDSALPTLQPAPVVPAVTTPQVQPNLVLPDNISPQDVAEAIITKGVANE